MVSKNNISELNRKHANVNKRYRIQRTTLGVGSVAVMALLSFMTGGVTVSANEIDANQTYSEVAPEAEEEEVVEEEVSAETESEAVTAEAESEVIVEEVSAETESEAVTAEAESEVIVEEVSAETESEAVSAEAESEVIAEEETAEAESEVIAEAVSAETESEAVSAETESEAVSAETESEAVTAEAESEVIAEEVSAEAESEAVAEEETAEAESEAVAEEETVETESEAVVEKETPAVSTFATALEESTASTPLLDSLEVNNLEFIGTNQTEMDLNVNGFVKAGDKVRILGQIQAEDINGESEFYTLYVTSPAGSQDVTLSSDDTVVVGTLSGDVLTFNELAEQYENMDLHLTFNNSFVSTSKVDNENPATTADAIGTIILRDMNAGVSAVKANESIELIVNPTTGTTFNSSVIYGDGLNNDAPNDLILSHTINAGDLYELQESGQLNVGDTVRVVVTLPEELTHMPLSSFQNYSEQWRSPQSFNIDQRLAAPGENTVFVRDNEGYVLNYGNESVIGSDLTLVQNDNGTIEYTFVLTEPLSDGATTVQLPMVRSKVFDFSAVDFNAKTFENAVLTDVYINDNATPDIHMENNKFIMATSGVNADGTLNRNLAPTIQAPDRTHTVGEATPDLLEGVNVADDRDSQDVLRETITHNGDETVDWNTPGTYTVTYEVTDANGLTGTTTAEVTVISGTTTITDEVTEPIPFETEYRENPELLPGEERVVQEGQDGETTITYEVVTNNVTGEEVSRTETSREVTTEPVNEIIEVGTAVVDTEVIADNTPFETIVREVDDLPAGEERVIQEGQNGHTEVTYEVVRNADTGEEISRTEVNRTETPAVDRIVEVGTGIEADHVFTGEDTLPYDTIIRTDDTLNAGEIIVVQEGVEGLREFTYTTPTLDGRINGETVRTETIVRNPIDKIIVVGTKDLVAPTITTEVVEGGHNIIITNPDGSTETIFVADGQDGEDGQDGKDGEIVEEPVEEPETPVEEPETPVEEEPVEEPETPVEEEPVEEPETPVEEEPVEEPETPVEEEPVEEPETPVEEELTVPAENVASVQSVSTKSAETVSEESNELPNTGMVAGSGLGLGLGLTAIGGFVARKRKK